MTLRQVRVGTRGSRLALEQTRTVLAELREKSPGLDTQIVPVKTYGDRLPAESRTETDGKGAFTGDIEALLLRGEIDMAVHSLKDLPVELGGGLEIGATPKRGDPRDAFVSTDGDTLSSLPVGASIGTSSIRRRAQLLGLRRDLAIVEMHGNVETRVKKMGEMHLHGIVLAAAGMDRLSMGERIAERFPVDQIVPAAGQGTIAVEVRKGDVGIAALVSQISDEKTMLSARCERAFARAIGGDCYVPAGANASVNGRVLTLVGMIASPDGQTVLKKRASSTDPVGLGEALGEELLRLGGASLIREGAMRA